MRQAHRLAHEIHDNPGVFEILRGESTEAQRIMLTIAVCVLMSLAMVGAEALLR